METHEVQSLFLEHRVFSLTTVAILVVPIIYSTVTKGVGTAWTTGAPPPPQCWIRGAKVSFRPHNNMPRLSAVLHSRTAGELTWRTNHAPKLLTAGGLLQIPLGWLQCSSGRPASWWVGVTGYSQKLHPSPAQPYGLWARLAPQCWFCSDATDYYCAVQICLHYAVLWISVNCCIGATGKRLKQLYVVLQQCHITFIGITRYLVGKAWQRESSTPCG